MKVHLEWYEVQLAAHVGEARRINAIRNGWKDGHCRRDGWTTDVEGAAAELATAKGLNLYWPGSVGTFKQPDVGPLQVRSTNDPNPLLVIRTGDPDDDPYLLVTGAIPIFTLVGWQTARTVRSAGQRHALNPDRPPAFVMKPAQLRSIPELKDFLVRWDASRALLTSEVPTHAT